MKVESLVIVNEDVAVNDISNFAHTAHHARRVVFSGNLTKIVLVLLKGINKSSYFLVVIREEFFLLNKV